MKSPVTPAFYAPRDNSMIGFTLNAKVGDIEIPSEVLLDSFEGESELSVNVQLNTDALLERCHLTAESKLSLVVHLECDKLAIQRQVFQGNIDTRRARFTLSEVIGTIPNLVYLSGFTLEARVVALKPVPDDGDDPLICGFAGAILARNSISAYRQDQANILPIEWVTFADNRMWQVEFDFDADGDGVYDLEVPLYAAVRLALDTRYFSHCFEPWALGETRALAIALLGAALCTEVLLYCGERPELVDQLQSAFQQLNDRGHPSWIDDTSSLGYHLLTWFSKSADGRPFKTLSADFADSTVDSLSRLRADFASSAAIRGTR